MVWECALDLKETVDVLERMTAVPVRDCRLLLPILRRQRGMRCRSIPRPVLKIDRRLPSLTGNYVSKVRSRGRNGDTAMTEPIEFEQALSVSHDVHMKTHVAVEV